MSKNSITYSTYIHNKFAHLSSPLLSIYNRSTRRNALMKKTKIYLTEAEWRLVIYCLNDFRNKLLQEGRYTDIVDEVMLKAVKAPIKRVKVKASGEIMAG